MGAEQGLVAIVTGAGGGIGSRTAELFAGRGARVVVADIDRAAAAETVNKVAAAGGQAVAVTGDVAVVGEGQRANRRRDLPTRLPACALPWRNQARRAAH